MTASALSPIDRRIRTAAISRDWLCCGGATLVLLLLYLLLQNPFWVPGGDSEVYTSIARNLLIGKHFTFNGQPVTMVTPGWPWVLAAAMKISPTFLFLKLLTMSCMLGSLSASYFICRRFASPGLCAIAMLLSGILSYVYELTFWLHSDALFCLTSAASVLLALQISEQPKRSTWRIVAVIALCSINVLVRYAGMFTWLLVAAALIDGRLRPRMNRYWITLLLSGGMTMGTFVTIRYELNVNKQTLADLSKFGDQKMDAAGEPAVVATADSTVAKSYNLFNPAAGGVLGLIGRFLAWGNWSGSAAASAPHSCRAHGRRGSGQGRSRHFPAGPDQ